MNHEQEQNDFVRHFWNFTKSELARGLMMILEEILLESMYHLPFEKKVKEIVVTREMIERKYPVFEVVPRSEEAA